MNKMSRCLFALAVSLTIVMASCATVQQVSLETNRDLDYSDSTNKLFVTIEAENIKIKLPSNATVSTTENANQTGKQTTTLWAVESPFDAFLSERIDKTLKQLGIETKAVVLTGLELSGDAVEKEREAFQSNKTLSIQRSGQKVDVHHGGYSTPQGGFVSTTSTETTYFFDVAVADEINNKKVWRSNMTVKGEMDATTVDEIVHDLLVALKTAYILDFDSEKLAPVTLHTAVTPAGWVIIGVSAIALGGIVGWYSVPQP
jgi:hypothetical protein